MMMDKNLENVLNLYKSGKISAYIAEKELKKSIEETSGVSEVVLTDAAGKFFIASMPYKNGESYVTKIFINAALLVTEIVSVSQVIDHFFKEVRKAHQLNSNFAKFISAHKDMEITKSDYTEYYLNVYKDTVSTFNEELKNNNLKFIPSSEVLDNAISEILNGNDTIDTILERLSVENILPLFFIEKIKELCKEDDEPDSYEDETPFYKEIKKVCTGTIGIRKSEKIPFDYEPSTNQ